MERNPQSQGYSVHQFDVVIAASVLHATRNIAETLTHIRRLLRPGGLLLLLEETQFHAPFDLTMGLQQGFDRFEDSRQQHPLLSQAQWQHALSAAGFTDCQVFQPPDPIAEWLGFDVFLVRGPISVQSFQPQVLQTALAQKLPEYMRPDAIVPLDTLPLTANGKVDRRALRSQWQAKSTQPTSETDYTAPRNAIETAIATLWQELLRCDRVGIDDNFFERGGDSLLATQMMTRIRQMFCVEVPLRTLFQSPTVAALAAAIADALAAQVDPDIIALLDSELTQVEPVTGEK
ncbi:MAG: methyltransferase [Leptolyngbyaceae cyanobacterium SM1_4_3]|nr:methyltransferase [Leptolyngbyaceae cyanobacterium SM1_4_3]